MRNLLLVAAVAALTEIASCASAGVPPSDPIGPERSTIAVAVSVTPAAALERVKAAFVDEGLAIGTANTAGLVTTEPVIISPSAALIHSAIVYKATIIGDSAGRSRVILSAVTRTIDKGDFTKAFSGTRGAESEHAVTSHMPSMDVAHGSHGWAKLERVAADLRRH